MPRKCYICGKKDDPINMFIDDAFKKVTCKTPECMAKYGIWKSDKIKEAQQKKKNRAAKRKKRDHPHIYHPELKKDLQTEINKIARLIDKGCRCIDCHRTISNPCWDGGHFQSVGSNNSLRYNLHNIFKQTRYCNSMSEGNKTAFEAGIKEMYGGAYLLYCLSLRGVYKRLDLPYVELPEKLDIAREIVRELEKLDMVYTPQQRIKLRNEYNMTLGIYKTQTP